MASEEDEYFTGGHMRCKINGNYDPAQCIKQTFDDTYHPSYDTDMCFCYLAGDKVILSFFWLLIHPV